MAYTPTRSRIVTSTLAGCTAGILGLTNLGGFLFYFVASAVMSGLLFGMAKGDIKHTAPSPMAVLWDGTMGNLLCYVFWWTYPFISAFACCTHSLSHSHSLSFSRSSPQFSF